MKFESSDCIKDYVRVCEIIIYTLTVTVKYCV